MQNRKWFSLLSSLLIIVPACSPEEIGTLLVNCEDSIDLGHLSLKDHTTSFYPYETKEQLIFVNEEDEEFVFDRQLNRKTDTRLVVENLCSGGGVDRQDRFYTVEFWDNYYQGGIGNQIFMFVVTRAIEEHLPEEEFFYDTYQLSGSFQGAHFGSLKIITSLRDRDEDFPETFLEENQSFQFFEDLELAGNTYNKVYVSEAEAAVYVSSGLGIIGFKDADGGIWLRK